MAGSACLFFLGLLTACMTWLVASVDEKAQIRAVNAPRGALSALPPALDAFFDRSFINGFLSPRFPLL